LTIPPSENTHLTSPTAIAADDGRVAVADFHGLYTRIHIFTEENPVATIDTEGSVKKMRLSGSLLFVLQEDKFIVFDLEDKENSFEVEIALTSFDINSTHLLISFGNFVKAIEIAALSESDIDADELGANEFNLRQISDVAATDSYLQAIYIDNADNMRYRNYHLPHFGNATAAQDVYEDTKAISAGNGFWLFSESGFEIDGTPATVLHESRAVAIFDAFYLTADKIYVLDGVDKVVRQYTYDEEYGFTPTGVVLGSNTKNFDIPDINSFTLSDFRFAKVTSDNAYAYLPEKLENQQGFSGDLANNRILLVLGQPVSCFCFVWLPELPSDLSSNKFSFVEEEALAVDESMIVEREPYAEMETATQDHWLYRLPHTGSGSALAVLPKEKAVTVLADLNTSALALDWCFVSVDNNGQPVFGFMLKNALQLPDNTPPTPIFDEYKANPPVLQTLKVYAEPDETSERKYEIQSGSTVYVFKNEGNEKWAKIRVTLADGTPDEGYVLRSRLIAKSGMTSTLAAGLVTGISVILIMTILAVLNKRRKKHLNKLNTNPAMYADIEKLD